jgi:hypothetical protein
MIASLETASFFIEEGKEDRRTIKKGGILTGIPPPFFT